MPALMPDVSSFLTRGRQRTLDMQAAGDAAYDIEDNATSGRRPDLLAQMQTKLALEGMRNARARESQGLRRGDLEIEHMDPAFQREQSRLNTLSAADTFMDPRMARMRGAQIDDAATRRRALGVADAEVFRDPSVAGARSMDMAEDIDRRRGLEELAITLGMDPRRLEQIEAEHRRKMEITRAGSPFGAFMGGGPQPQARIPAVSNPPLPPQQVTLDQIRAYVASKGGTEQDVLTIMQKASASGRLAQ